MIQVWREEEEEGRGGKERREGEREGEEGEEGGRGGRERKGEKEGGWLVTSPMPLHQVLFQTGLRTRAATYKLVKL